MECTPPSYIVATPMRNESSRLLELFSSIESQTLRPCLWTIVDDGSTDESLSLATELADERDWVRIVERDVHGHKRDWQSYGSVVSLGIEVGLKVCSDLAVEPPFIAVVDADTVVEADYFEILVSGLAGNARIAVATGVIQEVSDSGRVGPWLPRGCARIYRKSFLDEVAGFPKAPSPDTILEIKAKNRNYQVYVDFGAKGRTRASSISRDADGFRCLGISRYYLGLDLVGMLLTSVLLSVAGGVRMGYCFLDAYIGELMSKSPRIDDSEVREYFSQSWRRLIPGQESVASIKNYIKRGFS